ncbi:Protein spire 2 [Liparis tanakae]|uniref:Protein spire 2 n=1 Tax=Liparis tanakae TaxID=230148 RepID=A0A4Z2E4S7_9TELE|nr:Protein spire 2 [Liparis tanakae]
MLLQPIGSLCVLQLVRSLGVAIYRALDWGLDDSEERELGPQLERLIERMAGGAPGGADGACPAGGNAAADEGYSGQEEEEEQEEQGGAMRPVCTFRQVMALCASRLADPGLAPDHYQAVCRALLVETLELQSFLIKIRDAKEVRQGPGPRRGHAGATPGTRLVHVWSTSGPPLVHVWSTSGPRLVHIWSTSGPHLVHVWSTSGPHLVHIWSTSGPRLVHVWSTSGPRLVHVWSTSGPHLVHVWSTSGPHLVHMLKKITTTEDSDDRTTELDALKHTDWARLWVQLMKDLRQGVKLKKVQEQPFNLLPSEFSLTPFEMLMQDIRTRKVQLRKVMVRSSM